MIIFSFVACTIMVPDGDQKKFMPISKGRHPYQFNTGIKVVAEQLIALRDSGLIKFEGKLPCEVDDDCRPPKKSERVGRLGDPDMVTRGVSDETADASPKRSKVAKRRNRKDKTS